MGNPDEIKKHAVYHIRFAGISTQVGSQALTPKIRNCAGAATNFPYIRPDS